VESPDNDINQVNQQKPNYNIEGDSSFYQPVYQEYQESNQKDIQDIVYPEGQKVEH